MIHELVKDTNRSVPTEVPGLASENLEGFDDRRVAAGRAGSRREALDRDVGRDARAVVAPAVGHETLVREGEPPAADRSGGGEQKRRDNRDRQPHDPILSCRHRPRHHAAGHASTAARKGYRSRRLRRTSAVPTAHGFATDVRIRNTAIVGEEQRLADDDREGRVAFERKEDAAPRLGADPFGRGRCRPNGFAKRWSDHGFVTTSSPEATFDRPRTRSSLAEVWQDHCCSRGHRHV
jgi:hypothetical protein